MTTNDYSNSRNQVIELQEFNVYGVKTDYNEFTHGCNPKEKSDINDFRESMVWLSDNGYTYEMNRVLFIVKDVQTKYFLLGCPEDPAIWKSYLQRKARQLNIIDTFYYEHTGKHMFRTFNALDNEDLIRLFGEIIDFLNIKNKNNDELLSVCG